MAKTRVLFLCTGNSCRSQMAEGWLRALGGDVFEAASAGTEPIALNPGAEERHAIFRRVRDEIGVSVERFVANVGRRGPTP